MPIAQELFVGLKLTNVIAIAAFVNGRHARIRSMIIRILFLKFLNYILLK